MGVDPEYQYAALSAAVKWVRRHPDLPQRLGSRDTAWRTITAAFLADRRIAAYLGRVEYRNPQAAGDLVDAAAQYLTVTQPARIQALYRHLRESGELDVLSTAERLTMLAVFCQAMRPDQHGGARVVMSTGYRRTLIRVQFGHDVDPRELKRAAQRLRDRKLVEVDLGRPWSGGPPSSTRFTLMLNPPSPIPPGYRTRGDKGVGQSVGRARVPVPDEVPVMTEDTVKALERYQGRRREAKHRHHLLARIGKAEDTVEAPLPDLSRLLDVDLPTGVEGYDSARPPTERVTPPVGGEAAHASSR